MSERKPHLWCLFSRLENRRIEGLLFDEARAFVSNLVTTELEHWFAWKEEWPDWRPVTEVEGLTEMIFRAMSVSPPPPPRGTETEEAGETSLRIENVASINKVLERTFFPQTSNAEEIAEVAADFVVRDKKRYKKRMQVVILAGGKVFKTFTRDISVGGMNLEETLPDWISGHFKVRIAKPSSKQQIELTCCVIDNQKAGERFRLAILPLQSVDDERNLEMWLAA